MDDGACPRRWGCRQQYGDATAKVVEWAGRYLPCPLMCGVVRRLAGKAKNTTKNGGLKW